MKRTDWAYIAGFLDADGTIYFPKYRPNQVRIKLYQQDPSILQELQGLMGFGRISCINRRTGCHALHINRRDDVYVFIRGVRPYVRVKQVKLARAARLLTVVEDVKRRRT